MHDLSFAWPHPRWSTPLGDLTVRIHTHDNVYGLDPARCHTVGTASGIRVDCTGLTWAGGEPCPGAATVDLAISSDEVAVVVSATHADGVRSVGVTLHDLPAGTLSGMREGDVTVPDDGRLVGYPNGWYDLSTPFLVLKPADGVPAIVVRSTDDAVHVRRFAVKPHPDDPGVVDLDLVVDSPATGEQATWNAPQWRLERTSDPSSRAALHAAEVSERLLLPEWETRPDVPQWMHQVSLVAALHGQHFTGHVFADYAAMLHDLQVLAEQIEGHRVLAYLPGWEGRYYRWYGRYRPDPRMGGDDGFARLVGGAHELGVHVMPMFGANYAARDLPGFERWAAPGLLRSAGGVLPSGSVDWDGSRHFDHASGAIVNPAFQPWRDHLVTEIARLHQQFGFDAAFLDISALYSNDPQGDPALGLACLAEELRSACSDLLVAGEGWYDAIAAAIPLVQTGHRDTVPVLHDDAGLFARSNRQFAHLCLGDPAYESTGVHEAGRNPVWRLPLRHDVLPTLSIVGATLRDAPDRVAQVVGDAREYARRFLR